MLEGGIILRADASSLWMLPGASGPASKQEFRHMSKKAFNKIKAGIEDAVAYVRGDQSRARIIHMKAAVQRWCDDPEVKKVLHRRPKART